MNKILQPGQSYTFSNYFQMSFPIEDILKELDYNYTSQKIDLPIVDQLPSSFSQLNETIKRNLRLTSLLTEDARKQAAIAPILFELCDYYQTKLNIEYPVNASEYLKGTLDYYIKNSKELLVVEAKNADLTRGFTQLAVELIALACFEDSLAANIYGAVTIGNIWKFGFLDRQHNLIYEDLNFYIIPDQLETLFKILLGLLAA
ncbi:hypothetical protein [Nostoc sp. TCL26-01]|uniref:hypothetical protein n=1 Tax=Nostoc sp. TCL26-01 TaxID=2576904 RepID=UPI0015BB2277|nr:hypothetical protein [Nostoc sp. TCL26-01]QLE54871.1 hypothetical protein FD725_04660 [Nostoc sp. TCL26-01]